MAMASMQHMQQVCSWYADDHDIHVKEHVLTHTHRAWPWEVCTSFLWGACASVLVWY